MNNSPYHGDEACQIDKKQVRRSFDKAAPQYHQAARLQQDTAEQLVSRLDYIQIEPKTILDIGCGTGFVSQRLKKRFPKAKMVSLDLSLAMLQQLKKNTDRWFSKSKVVCADAEQLPFAANSFDLVISNLTFQWCQNTQSLFAGIQQCLKEEGLLLFSSFGTDTLTELRQSWQGVDNKVHINHFEDMHEIGDVLINLGYHLPVMDAERITEYFPDVFRLMRALKIIGAHNVNSGRNKSLSGKQGFDSMKQNYEKLRNQKGLPLTWEIIYGIGWKKSLALKPEAQVIPFTHF